MMISSGISYKHQQWRYHEKPYGCTYSYQTSNATWNIW